MRVAKAYQGKGFGKAAYKLVCEWAAKALKVNLKAKCFKENERSKETILSCGFIAAGEDKDFYYFKYNAGC